MCNLKFPSVGTLWAHSSITNHVTLLEKMAHLQSSLQSFAAFARQSTSGSGSLASQTKRFWVKLLCCS